MSITIYKVSESYLGDASNADDPLVVALQGEPTHRSSMLFSSKEVALDHYNDVALEPLKSFEHIELTTKVIDKQFTSRGIVYTLDSAAISTALLH